MSDKYSDLAQHLRPYWLADDAKLSGVASVSSGGGGGGALSAHALSGVYHTGQLAESQATWAGTKAELVAHALLADVHHAQQHALISSNHTASGLTAGHVVRASGATTFAFAQLQHTDLGGVTANQHHNQIHSVTGGDHTISASKWALVGATADNTLGLIWSDSNPGATEAVLRTDAAGMATILKVRTATIDTASGDLTLQPADDLILSPVALVKMAASKSIQSATFSSGFAGGGWRIDDGISRLGYTTAEVDDLTVRGILRVYELLIHKIRTGNGSYLFANGGKVSFVDGSAAPAYTLGFDEDHGLAVGDLIRAQKFTGSGTYQSNCTVTYIYDTKFITATLTSGTVPAVGFEFVRLGNNADANRRGGVYITADDSNAPYIDIYDGVAAFADFGSASKTKARLGKLTGITSTAGEYGLYAGAGVADTDAYFRLSNSAARFNNVDIKMFSGGNQKVNISATGADVWFGVSTSDKRLIWDGSLLTVTGKLYVADASRLDGAVTLGAAGGIYQGSGTFASPTTGLKVWNDSGAGKIGTYIGGDLQAWIDSAGVGFNAAAGKFTGSTVSWWSGGNRYLSVGTNIDLGSPVSAFIETRTSFPLNITATSAAMTLTAASSTLTLSAANVAISVTGAATIGGNAIWHAGNLTPGNYAALSGAIFTGAITTAGSMMASGAVNETALGLDNIRIGVASGTPRMVFEDHSYTQWEVDNFQGDFRFFTPGTVHLVLQGSTGNVGIGGTPTSGYKLDVGGSLRLTGDILKPSGTLTVTASTTALSGILTVAGLTTLTGELRTSSLIQLAVLTADDDTSLPYRAGQGMLYIKRSGNSMKLTFKTMSPDGTQYGTFSIAGT
jgi:hypothetical protein